MRRLLLLVGFAGVLAFALGAVARATPPEHFPVEHVDDTSIIPAAPEGPCAFEIEQHVVGDIRHTDFFDNQGNKVRELDVFSNFRVTFSANGKSITTVSPAAAHVTINPDGSAVVRITGLGGHLIVGGRCGPARLLLQQPRRRGARHHLPGREVQFRAVPAALRNTGRSLSRGPRKRAADSPATGRPAALPLPAAHDRPWAASLAGS